MTEQSRKVLVTYAAFNDAKPEGINEGMEIFNEEMLLRAGNRSHVRQLWGIGQPFDVTPSLRCGGENGAKFCWRVQIWNQ